MKNKVMSIKRFCLTYLLTIVGSVLIDQLTKIWASVLDGQPPINIIGSWLTLTWTINTGASFGMLEGSAILFFVTTIIGLPTFLFFLWRSRKHG
ncbi:MAG: signal peptidase II, partial [Clostridia bacterium]